MPGAPQIRPQAIIEGPGGSSSPLTTKGDILAHGTIDARLPVGANGRILEADSTQTLGLGYSTTDFDANSHNLSNLLHFGFEGLSHQPTFINIVANMTVALNAGRGGDSFGILQISTTAAFTGAAADTKLFEVQFFATHSITQGLGFMNPANTTAVPPQFYSQFGSIAFGFGSFSVFNHVAIGTGLQGPFDVAYFAPGT